MNALDIIILLILAIGAIMGIRKGFVSQAFSLISILVSVWLSFTCASAFGEWLSQYISTSEVILKIISFLIIFIGVGLLCNLLGKLVEKIFKLAMLGWLNRLLGAIFSMMKYVLFIGIAIQLFTSLNQQFGFVDNATLAQSGLYTAIKTISDVVFPYFKELITSKPL